LSTHEIGSYTGRLVLHPLPDGRRMRVLEDFGFLEADGLHWQVPPDTIVDGATIPRPLWSLIGGPFEGRYRDASVVHDYYCDVRSADWRAVHRVFYRAMLVSGVSEIRAKIMYAAVYFAGPRWGETVVENVRLGPPKVPTRDSDNGWSEYFTSPGDQETHFYVHVDPDIQAMINAISVSGTAFDEITGQYHDAKNVTLNLEVVEGFIRSKNISIVKLEELIERTLRFMNVPDQFVRLIATGNLEVFSGDD
jgi:hypothetical protein